MQRYFQSAYLSRYVIIFFLAVLFWTPSFFLDKNISLAEPALFQLLTRAFQGNYYLLTTFAFLISLLSALLINQLSSESGISIKISTISALLFVMFAFAFTFSTSMSPFIWVILCITLMMRLLFGIPMSINQPVLLFNAGFIAGIASLLAPESILFLLVIWMSLITHRSNHWRNYATSTLGIALPWVFLSSWYFWNDNMAAFNAIWSNFLTIDRFQNVEFLPDINFVLFAFIALTSFLVSLRSVIRLREKSINLRHNLAIVNYLLIVSFAAFLISSTKYAALFIVVPAVLILTSYLGNVKDRKIFDIVTIIFILLVVVNQYSRIFYSFIQ